VTKKMSQRIVNILLGFQFAVDFGKKNGFIKSGDQVSI